MSYSVTIESTSNGYAPEVYFNYMCELCEIDRDCFELETKEERKCKWKVKESCSETYKDKSKLISNYLNIIRDGYYITEVSY